MNDCNGCRSKLTKEMCAKQNYTDKEIETIFENDRYAWICISAPHADERIIINCPCQKCLIKSVCENACGEFVEATRINNVFIENYK